ncbi:MAG: hypothetical protein ACHQXA_07870 [Gemmatimonadales bacterium]
MSHRVFGVTHAGRLTGGAMPLIQFVGILALLATVGLALLGLSGALIAWGTGRRALAGRLLAGGALVVFAYLGGVAAVSLLSREEIRPVGVAKRFCGFYLDCHLAAAVISVDTASQLGDGIHPLPARGTFWIVTVRLSSDARREPLRFEGLRYRVRLPNGRWFVRVHDAEARLGSDPEATTAARFAPGESRAVRLVFDLPKGAAPLLSIKEGVPPDTMIEGLLLGDEDSALHRAVLFALSLGSPAA